MEDSWPYKENSFQILKNRKKYGALSQRWQGKERTEEITAYDVQSFRFCNIATPLFFLGAPRPSHTPCDSSVAPKFFFRWDIFEVHCDEASS